MEYLLINMARSTRTIFFGTRCTTDVMITVQFEQPKTLEYTFKQNTVAIYNH